MSNYIKLQYDIIRETGVIVRDYCPDGCRMREHAHPKKRWVCKHTMKNSINSAFDLYHEIGHIYTKTSTMRRCESEFYATQWAIDQLKSRGISIPQKIVDNYQRYIDNELERGKRRGGSNYTSLKLKV